MTRCEGATVPKVFISFVRTNRSKVERFAQTLREYGVLVWLERDQIASRTDWQTALRNAIRQGAFFIACFSRQYRPRQQSHLNRELMEAIKELRQRPTDQSWFIPVALNDCTIPDWSIGVGHSLLRLEVVDLSRDWEEGIQKIVRIIDPAGRYASTRNDAGERGAEAGRTGHESNSEVVSTLQRGPELLPGWQAKSAMGVMRDNLPTASAVLLFTTAQPMADQQLNPRDCPASELLRNSGHFKEVSIMAGKNTAAFGIYATRAQVERAVDELKRENFRSTDISVLMPENQGSKDFAHEKGTKAPEGAAAGAGTGAIIGGTLGWLAGIGALAIPGVGPFIAAGPIMAALAGMGAGGALGGLSGALIGLGIPEYEAKRYEGRIKHGGILLSVHCDNSEWTHKAKQILERTGAEDVSSTGEASADYEESDRPMPRSR